MGPFAWHMVQHLLVGDLVPLAVVILLRPRVGRALAALALPVWVAHLAVWHVPVVFDAAVRYTWLHALQHFALLAAGLLLWSALLGSALSLAVRLGLVAAMMLAGIILSSVLLWWPRILYAQTSSLTDQRVGGGLMLLEGMIVALSVAAWLILQLIRAEEAASPSP